LRADGVEVGEAVEVECRTVDELVFDCGMAAPTLMKIDVEGWEYEVVCGAQRLFDEAPPKALVVEAACASSGEVMDMKVVIELERLGYLVERIQRPEGLIEPRENFLAVRRETGGASGQARGRSRTTTDVLGERVGKEWRRPRSQPSV
jgi:hypothetical protein